MPVALRSRVAGTLAVALLGGGVVLAGCGGGGSAPAPAPTSAPDAATGVVVPPVSVPPVVVPPIGSAGTGSSAPSPSSAAALPPGFPVPPGATVTGATDDGHEIVARLAVPDGSSAGTFWRQALPAAGYTVESADGAAGVVEIRLAGRGYAGDSQIVVQGSTAVVQLDRE